MAKKRLFRGIPVMTFKEFAGVHGTSPNTATRFFNQNLDLFTDGVDYFIVTKSHISGEPYRFKYTTKIKYSYSAIRTSPDELQIPANAGPTENVHLVNKATYLTRSGSIILLDLIQKYVDKNKDTTKIHLKTTDIDAIDTSNDLSIPKISVANELVTHAIYARVSSMLKYNRPMPVLKNNTLVYEDTSDKDKADLYDTMAIDLLNKVHSTFGVPNADNIIDVLKFIQTN